MKITLLTGKTFSIEQEIDFPIKVIKSSKCKRLTLRIDIKKRIPVMTIPKFCSSKKAINFAISNQEWIEKSLNQLPQAKPFEDGDKFCFLGNIITIKHSPEQKAGVFIKNNILYVSGEAEFLSRRVKDFIKKQAQTHLLELSRTMAKKIDCEVKRVAIKDTKSRWGSCSSLNNINYNWRIVLAPIEVINYLVAHEVSHLKHKNHHTEFWQCVKNLCPQTDFGKEWLKENSNLLHIYE